MTAPAQATLRAWARVTRVSDLSAWETIAGLAVARAVRPDALSASTTVAAAPTLDAAIHAALAEAVARRAAEAFAGPAYFAPEGAPVEDWPGLPERPVAWVAADDLLAERRTWLPFARVHARLLHPDLEPGLVPDLVGLAAAPELETARQAALLACLEAHAPVRRLLDVRWEPGGAVRAAVEIGDASLLGVPAVAVRVEGGHVGLAARATPEAALDAALARAVARRALAEAGGALALDPARSAPWPSSNEQAGSIADLPRLPSVRLEAEASPLVVVRVALPELAALGPRRDALSR